MFIVVAQRLTILCNLAPLFEKEKLAANGGKYEDWIHTLRCVLKNAKKEYVLDQPLRDSPMPGASQDVINVVKSIMLSCMDEVLRKHFEKFSAIEIVEALEVLYHKEPTEVHEMSKALDECKIAEVGEQGDRLANYYGSLNAMEIDFPRHRKMI